MLRCLFPLVLLTLLAAGPLAGCAGQGSRTGRGTPRVLRTAADSLADWRARADSIDAGLRALEQVTGRVEQGGSSSRFTAWFAGSELRVIREELDLGAQGSRTGRYYFDRGIPRFALESGKVLAGSAQAPTLKQLEREMLFDDFGALAAGRKTLDGETSAVAGYEAGASVGHAQQLRVAAQAARAGERPPGGAEPGAAKPAK